MYVSFAEYQTLFGGEIPSDLWERVARKACAYIDRITFDRLKRSADIPQEVKHAVCAVAESFFSEQNAVISSTVKTFNNDGYSENQYTPTEAAQFYAEERVRAVDLYLSRAHPLRYRGVD